MNKYLLLGVIPILLGLITPPNAEAAWVIPTGHTNGAGWSNGQLARDGSTTTYASHSPTGGWGGWLTFSFADTVWSDRFRVLSDFGYGEVDSVQVEVSTDNVTWTKVFAGAVLDGSWDTKLFTAQNVLHARFRFHRITTKYIMWLYELQLFETPMVINLPTVTTTAATSVDETSGVIHGLLVDNGGEPCDIRFQYGLTAAYELGSTPWVPGYLNGSTAGFMITGATPGATYHFRAQAQNSQGISDGLDATFICGPRGSGWLSPTSNTDATGRWTDNPRSYDDEFGSFASCLHASGDAGGPWGPYLYLEHAPAPVDSIRFYAKDDANIDRVQVDISNDGVTWTSVYDAPFANRTWVKASFTPQVVNQARVRFHVSSNNVGLYWELNEFDFHVTKVPILAAIGPQSVLEGDTLTVAVSATDADGDSLILTALGLPANASFVDNGDGTGELTFSPDLTQAGVHNITIQVSDGVLVDSEVVAVTVTNVPQVPILAAIGPQSVLEGDTLTVAVSASDASLDSLVYTLENLPANAGFVDNGNGTGMLTFTPDFTQAGVFNVRIIVATGAPADSELVVITVTNVPQAPVLAAIGPQSVPEGDTLTVAVSASDVDGDSLSLSTTALPANTSFLDNGDGTGSLTFTPDFTQAGVFNVTFTAADSALADSELVVITVTDVNTPPTLAAIGPQSVPEGDTLTVAVSATDGEGDSLSLSAAVLPANASFLDNGDGTGSLTFTPDFTQAGVFNVTFTVADSALADSELVVITVTDVNRAPVLAAIGPQSVLEGDTLTVAVSATDADGDSLSLSAAVLPPNAGFIDNGDGTGSLTFTPDFTQAGVFNVTFTAADSALADSELVVITVTDVNVAPVLAAIGPQSIPEGDTLTVAVSATDAGGDSLSLSAAVLPVNAAFVDNGDGTGTLTFTPDFDQAGVLNLTFLASDGALADSELVVITVTDVNRAPVLASIGPQSVPEGDTLTVAVIATDADGDSLSLSAAVLPSNAGFIDNGDGTGSLTFTPDFTQAGVFNVTFTVADSALADSELVVITVTDVNRAPVLASIGPQSVLEGDTLTVAVSATDADGDSLSLSAAVLPPNAGFVDNGDGTGSLTFTPDFTQAGVFNVTFTVADSALADSELVVITVTDVNRAPVLAAIGPQSVLEGDTLTVAVNATDADGDSLSLSAAVLPPNAGFVDNGDGTGSLTFTPDFTQAGVFNVTFTVADSALADSELVVITVTDVNRAPVLAAIGPQSVLEADTLTVAVSATDADGDSLSLSAAVLPPNAGFVDNGDGTGSLTFTPDFTQAGVLSLSFFASDGALADSELVILTVTDVNRAPVLAAIGPQSVLEGDTLTVAVNATDADGDSLSLSAAVLPPNAGFLDNGDGTGSLTFAPDFTQAGVFNVTFMAADSALADTELVAITVTQVNQSPLLESIGALSVPEGDSLTVVVIATDPDGDSLTLSATNLPPNAAFVDHGDHTGSLSFSPDFTQAGYYTVAFRVSDGDLEYILLVTITVTEVNRAPILSAIGPQSVLEGDTLTVAISAVDLDGDSVDLTAEGLPPGAGFTDFGEGAGSMVFVPDLTQAGMVSVTFFASDGALVDSEVVVITVINLNRAPTLAAIGPLSVLEGDTLTVEVSATDADGDSLNLSAAVLPPNAGFVDNGDGTGSLIFTPDFTQAGVFDITVSVLDSALADSELVVITVIDVNRAPVLAPIGSRSIAEGDTLAVAVSAEDPDGDSLTLGADNLPANAWFTDHGDGHGSLVFAPEFIQTGEYEVTFMTSDGALADSELVTLTVTDVNRAPFLSAIGPQSVPEGDTLSVAIRAEDPDGDSIVLSAEDLPDNSEFLDHGDGTGRLVFIPDFTQAGSYSATFTASDGALADSEAVVITVTELNRPPVLASIGPQTASEGDTLTIGVSATDPDGDGVSMSVDSLPANAGFTDHGDGAGSLTFMPDFSQAGVFSVTFLASDGALSDSEAVVITVTGVNRPPVLEAPGSRAVAEGDTLTVTVSAADPDGDSITLNANNLPANAGFLDHGDGTGSLVFAPDFTQDGSYSVSLLATDGSLTDSGALSITVTETNRPPVLAGIDPASVYEGDSLTVDVSAEDPDGDSITLSADNLPLNSWFVDHGDGTGRLTFGPDYTQAGVYGISIEASDGSLGDTALVELTVEDSNRPPVLLPQAPTSVSEGERVEIEVSAVDPDGSIPRFETGELPRNMDFTDREDGTALIAFHPDYDQAGAYEFLVIVTDGALADSTLMRLVVTETNRAPVVDVSPELEEVTVRAGERLELRIHAHDPDESTPSLSATKIPVHASFADSGRGFGVLVFEPEDSQLGTHSVTIVADDGALSDSLTFEILVTESPIPKVFALQHNFPNPFRQATTVGYSLPEQSHVTIQVYNVQGQMVRVLVDRDEPAGNYAVSWDGTDSNGQRMAAGTYFYRFRAGHHTERRKMLLLN